MDTLPRHLGFGDINPRFANPNEDNNKYKPWKCVFLPKKQLKRHILKTNPLGLWNPKLVMCMMPRGTLHNTQYQARKWDCVCSVLIRTKNCWFSSLIDGQLQSTPASYVPLANEYVARATYLLQVGSCKEAKSPRLLANPIRTFQHTSTLFFKSGRIH